jgi:small basic protein (TIGR04137 family)
MSLDRSLKSANALVRHRNVLTRAERLLKLAEAEKWNEQKSVYGLPKVAHRRRCRRRRGDPRRCRPRCRRQGRRRACQGRRRPGRRCEGCPCRQEKVVGSEAVKR